MFQLSNPISISPRVRSLGQQLFIARTLQLRAVTSRNRKQPPRLPRQLSQLRKWAVTDAPLDVTLTDPDATGVEGDLCEKARKLHFILNGAKGEG